MASILNPYCVECEADKGTPCQCEAMMECPATGKRQVMQRSHVYCSSVLRALIHRGGYFEAGIPRVCTRCFIPSRARDYHGTLCGYCRHDDMVQYNVTDKHYGKKRAEQLEADMGFWKANGMVRFSSMPRFQ